jgi:predicted transcriptional regulator
MAKSKRPGVLTRAEAEIMRVLWNRGRATVHEVLAGLGRDVAYTTVLTMLKILEQKGYVSRELVPEGGRAHVYRPIVEESQVRRSHVRELIGLLFDGRPNDLVSGVLDDEKLTAEDLRRLRERIDDKLGGARRSGKR